MYVPHHVSQVGIPGPCDYTSCWACVASWMLAGATRGRLELGPNTVRDQLRAWDCRPGGLGDIAHLLERHNVPYRWHTDLEAAEAVHLWRAGDAGSDTGWLYAMPTDYDVLVDRPDTGVYHMVGLVGDVDHDAIRVMDPMERAIRPRPTGLMTRAGVAYGRQHSDGRTLDLLGVRVPRPQAER